MKKLVAAALMLLSFEAAWTHNAPDDYDDFLKKAREEYDAFRKESDSAYDSFRRQANKAYADFLTAPWDSVASTFLNMPYERSVTPKPLRDIDIRRQDRVIEFDEIYQPDVPTPQPQPVSPVVVAPQPTDEWLTFTYLGNTDKVRLGRADRFTINGVSEKAIASAWERLSSGNLDKTLQDCLNIRSKYRLPDWAYLNMLETIARTFLGDNPDEVTLLTAWLFCQSGYKMRFARDSDDKLVMLYACDCIVYGRCYSIDSTRYFPYKSTNPTLFISNASFPREKEMTLLLTDLPLVGDKISEPRQHKSARYPAMDYSVGINENLLDFFKDYPSSQFGNNKVSRWAIYANTPLSKEARTQLYPKLRQVVSQLSEREAVEYLLNWVQTAFVYKLDDDVWGFDRAFFPDETLYYPYADCEDRAILFSRLVRDLVGLDVMLVYYPNHLATAVAFNGNEAGDYIMLNGRRFIVCDPTIITGAPVGRTMTDMDNSAAKVVLLNR